MSAEKELARQGVFAGHDGLRGLAEADEFWAEQPYGTRFYYGPGGLSYLHRGVLQSAVAALDSASRLRDALEKIADSAAGNGEDCSLLIAKQALSKEGSQ